jgi:nicotinate-nucleotide pyrophosphorylase (carboxylating)
MLAEAVALVAGRAATEASGGVRLDNIGAVAASGVDYPRRSQLDVIQ